VEPIGELEQENSRFFEILFLQTLEK